jgi:diguanylate cyclase (GGDEF)-like protein
LRLEQRIFATDHNELTGALLDDWGLPGFFSAAARHCEHPDSSGLPEDSKERRLAGVLYSAMRLADICVVDNDRQAAALVPEFLRCVEHLAVNTDDVIGLVEETIANWQEWGRMLNVSTWPVLSFEELLAKSWEHENQASSPPDESAAATPSEHAPGEGGASNSGAACALRKGLRILVVDDDPVMLRVLIKLLSSSGHDVRGASDGDMALRIALETCPQLVITDWIMPGADGLELCRSLRGTDFGRQMYIILLTGQSDEQLLVDAFDAGVDDYVVKPFQAKPLFARIRAALRVIKLQDELFRDKQRIEKISADLAVANRRLEMDALTDVLTGLPNRRYLMERLSHDWAVARRSGQPLACMVLDIDHFKQINDTFGHDVGDQVLERVAMILKNSVRSTDVVCRHGGEEFIVVSADSDLESSLRSAERLRHAVETNVTSAFPQIQRFVTVSIGVAVRNEQTRTPEALLKAADEAMYRAKQSGRNRVCGARIRNADDSGTPPNSGAESLTAPTGGSV